MQLEALGGRELPLGERDLGLRAAVHQRQGYHGLAVVRVGSVVDEGVRQAGGGFDLAELAVDVEWLSLPRLHRDAELLADPRLELDGARAESPWPEPLGQHARIGHRPPDLLTRGGKRAGHVQPQVFVRHRPPSRANERILGPESLSVSGMGGTLGKLTTLGVAGTLVVLALVGCGGASAAAPDRVADEIQRNDASLRQAIDAWRSAAGSPSRPPADVVDRSADLQDEVALLGGHPNLARRVIPLLGGPLRGEITRLYAARRALLRLSAGSEHKKLKLG